MSAEGFMSKADDILAKIKKTQLPVIKEAASLIADSIAHGGALHYFDSGHCTGELLGRAGGLFAIHPIRLNISVEHPKPPNRPDEAPKRGWYQDARVIEFVLDNCHLRAGDVLYECSVTGSSAAVVELALGAKRRGVKVVALTSPTYSKAITSHHPSGQFLYQVADLVIDNCGEVGDAMLEIPGLDTPACPSSGLAFVYISWALLAEVMSQLLARGIKPQVYKSVNMPGAQEFNEKARAAYERNGI